MNNATFFSSGMSANIERVEITWAKFRKRHMLDVVNIHSEHDTIEWLLSDAHTAYWYDIGDIVEPEPGVFATVTGYMPSGSSNAEVYIVATNGESRWNLFVSAENPDEWNPKIPKGILDLARRQLQQNCPLKTATCG